MRLFALTLAAGLCVATPAMAQENLQGSDFVIVRDRATEAADTFERFAEDLAQGFVYTDQYGEEHLGAPRWELMDGFILKLDRLEVDHPAEQAGYQTYRPPFRSYGEDAEVAVFFIFPR